MEIKTWFQEDGKLAAQRDWVVTCKSTGEAIGRATSTWVMINMQVGRGRACARWWLHAGTVRSTPLRAAARDLTATCRPEAWLPASLLTLAGQL